ncbi:MAG: sialate O-acetylesterase [Rubripirellula sp.]|nr:sialate O-acetylesterase [Rubripirellula sp.]
MLKSFVFSTCTLILFCSTALAQLELPTVFSDHMVLQRDQIISIWGWAKPGDEITCSFAGRNARGTAAADGKWSVEFEEFSAGGPHQLIAKANEDSLTINDIYVGEVWLCSGQSNMAMKVRSGNNSEAELSAANHPMIRMFNEASAHATEPQDRCRGDWQVCSPETVGDFSATAYFFGRRLQQELNVPIGLINSSVGGTAVEAWTSMPAQKANDELKPMLLDFQTKEEAYDPEAAKARYEKALANWEKQQTANKLQQKKGQKKRAPRRPSLPSNPSADRNFPSNLFNGKIHPLIGYGIRGAIWYQGERNSNGQFSNLYDEQLGTLIADWRERWGIGNFPFAWVQLPNFRTLQTEPSEPSGWVNVRDGMLRALKIPHTGMAITVDVGDAQNIHPKNKQAVGARLARWALADVYDMGEQLPGGDTAMGPLFQSAQPEGNRINLKFTQSGMGLKSTDGAVQGFAVAGKDRIFHWANAEADGNKVSAWSDQVPNPVAVRYSWASNPIGNLVNSVGIPASPFRTDDWSATNEN